jgi:serine/threonine protein kinase
MNYLNNIKKKIVGDKLTTILLYHKYANFISFIKEKDYTNIINIIINDYKLNKIKNIIKNEEEKSYKQTIQILGVGGFGQVYKIDDNYCIKINISNTENYHEYLIPEKIASNPELKDFILVPIAMIEKIKLKGLINIIQLNIILIYILHCYVFDMALSETKIIDLLKNFHIDNLYKDLFKNSINKTYFNKLYNYYLKDYDNIDIIDNFLSVLRTIRGKNNQILNTGFIILMPIAATTSYKLYLNVQNKSISKYGIKASKIYNDIYRILFIQVALFIININDIYNYTHNDLKPDNILVIPCYEDYILKYKTLKFFFAEKFRYKIADFDFSRLQGIIENQKIYNTKLSSNTSWFTDIHYFIHKLFVYITETEINADLVFFQELHKTFIYPYCNTPFDKIQHNIISKHNGVEICKDGRFYLQNKDINISLLYNFLKSKVFLKWRCDTGKIYSNKIEEDNLSSITIEDLSIYSSSL